jgi:hypothetical protein
LTWEPETSKLCRSVDEMLVPVTNRSDILYTPDAIARAARLADAYARTLNGTAQGDVSAELDAALADIGSDASELRSLAAALAGLAGHAVQTASYLRLSTTGLSPEHGAEDALQAFEKQRAAVLYECAEALHELRRAKLPRVTLVEGDGDGNGTDHRGATRKGRRRKEKRSGVERRGHIDRRSHPGDSPPARVNRWLHGERRNGKERRSGSDRRASAARIGAEGTEASVTTPVAVATQSRGSD